MKSLLYIGGPLILFTWFAVHSNLLTFANEQPGLVHLPGVEWGGTFFGINLTQKDTYYCDENGNCTLVDSTQEFSEIEGLELEQEGIEYREGADSEYNKTKQPGLSKYADIKLGRMPTDFDWKAWKFMFEHQADIKEREEEFDADMREILEERAAELE